MTPQEWIAHNDAIYGDHAAPSGVWAIVANNVQRNAEHRALVAFFSTEEAAHVFVKGSMLEGVATKTEGDPYYRSFRRDSLLHDFNADVQVLQMGLSTLAGIAPLLHAVVIDPVLPTGLEPDVPAPEWQNYKGITVADKFWRYGFLR